MLITNQWMNPFLYFIVCIPFVLMSQSKKSMDRTYFDSGQIKTEGNLVEGKKHGEWVHYFESGQIKTINNFQNGIQEGKSFWYHPNGSIGWEENYVNGIAHGKFLYYDESGRLRIEKIYENGNEVSYRFDGKELKNN
jgi:antitoxin component YwqK of YwqJK toxin-antitoxin module